MKSETYSFGIVLLELLTGKLQLAPTDLVETYIEEELFFRSRGTPLKTCCRVVKGVVCLFCPNPNPTFNTFNPRPLGTEGCG